MDLTLTPREQLQADRQLLAAISRWTRHVGWKPHWMGWVDRDEQIAVCADDETIRIWHRHPETKAFPLRPREYVVESVSQGVDILAALGILPVEFSTGWQMGQWASEMTPAPGVVRVWDRLGCRWDRDGDLWKLVDDFHDEYDAGELVRWSRLSSADGPVSVVPPLVVEGDAE